MKINPIITSLLMIVLVNMTSTSMYAQEKSLPFEGRWNMVIYQEGAELPSWLEMRPWGYTMVGRFLHVGGSPRPLSEIKVEDNHFSFAVPWESESRILKLEGKMISESLQGTIHYPNGKSYKWSAHRAPYLPYDKNPVWGEPIVLFNGKNLNGWHALGENQWVAESGILKSPKAGSNLVSDDEFTDFKLHVEFRYPKNGNSGVYLRGRYEVQISDGKGKNPTSVEFGSIFGFLLPNEMVAKNPGEWQSFDITLIGRRVTVEANGSIIINDQIVPGITGGAMNGKEDEPGPFMLQGDHYPIEYRNIIVTPRVTRSKK